MPSPARRAAAGSKPSSVLGSDDSCSSTLPAERHPGGVIAGGDGDDIVAANRIESTEVVNPRVMRKVIVVLLLPFVTLIFIQGLSFALQFIAATALFYFVVVGYFISEITIRPPWYHHHPGAKELTHKGCPEYWGPFTHDPKQDCGLAYRDVTFPTPDGYRLSGWYVPAPSSGGTLGHVAPAVVLVHGGGRDRRAWLRHLPMFHRAGCAALLFDFREHGLSSGSCNGFTYGMKERIDVLSAAQYLKTTCGHRRVVAVGTSVGGSSVIMAAAMPPSMAKKGSVSKEQEKRAVLDGHLIDGVIAENPITTCAVLQDYVITNLLGGYFSRHWLSVYVFNVFRKTCSTWLNFRIGNKPSKHCQALHCIDAISPRPVLLMHGTNDDVVPMVHSEQLFAAAKEPKTLWKVDGAFHCGLYNKDPVTFERHVLQVLEAVAKH